MSTHDQPDFSFQATNRRQKITKQEDQCPECMGYGDIQFKFHPTDPRFYKCGDCDGTGKKPIDKYDLPRPETD